MQTQVTYSLELLADHVFEYMDRDLRFRNARKGQFKFCCKQVEFTRRRDLIVLLVDGEAHDLPC